MTCDDVRRSIPLIEYGELSFDEEEALHTHFAACAACRSEFERERAMHRLLDTNALEPSPFHLRACRDRLSVALEAERVNGPRYRSWWDGVKSAFSAPAFVPAYFKPVGALALVSLGFFAAQFSPAWVSTGVQKAGLLDPASSRVRYVEAGPGGGVQLVVDETRQRVISGRLDDDRIRALLLAAAKDPSDPGLRGESLEILKTRTESDDIRSALIYALQHDANDGVRLKAMEGLKRYASEPDVRKAMSQVLLTDANPGLRIQAVDLLTANAPEHNVVGLLQEIMHKEDNQYIRLQCEKALRQMKASIETY